jgi:hypothetical protein
MIVQINVDTDKDRHDVIDDVLEQVSDLDVEIKEIVAGDKDDLNR